MQSIAFLSSDPCEGGKACGECAGCRVINHVAQCNCPANYYGNALINCAKTMIPCDGLCECDEIGFCTTSCHNQNDCSCGEICHSGKCRIKCDINNACPKVSSENFKVYFFIIILIYCKNIKYILFEKLFLLIHFFFLLNTGLRMRWRLVSDRMSHSFRLPVVVIMHEWSM